jgi:hypothetical protein
MEVKGATLLYTLAGVMITFAEVILEQPMEAPDQPARRADEAVV